MPAPLFLTVLLFFAQLPENQPQKIPAPDAKPAEQDFAISMDVNLVVLGVNVVDGSGKAVTGLRRENFQVYENGRPQEVKLFLPEDMPVTAGLIVDGSASMRPKRQQTIEAALAFASYSNPQDEMFVVHFNENVSLGLSGPAPFTSDRQELRAALMRSPNAGRTALYDAIATGLKQLEQGARTKKVLVIFSDGGDNSSDHKLREIVEAAARSNVIIYTIGLFDENDRDRNPRVLTRLAHMTGGQAFLPKPGLDEAEVCKRIAREIRNQYTLAYAPAAQDSAFHAIKVTVATPDRRKVSVRTRTGYRGPENKPDEKKQPESAR